MKSKLTLLGIAALLAAALLLPLTRARADRQVDPPAYVVLAANYYYDGIVVIASSSSSGAPKFPGYIYNVPSSASNLVSLGEANAILKANGFRLDHVSDNCLEWAWAKP